MKIAKIVFNPLAENTYVIWDSTLQCAVIDAGNSTPEEDKVLEDFFTERGLTPVVAINTHGHFDHILGVEFLRSRYGAKFALHKDDTYLINSVSQGDVIYGIEIGATPKVIDIDLSEERSITFGETTLEVIETPGHTPGHISLLNRESNVLFTGDTIFRESIGRTDLPGGDYPTLMNSIINVILPLGDQTTIFAGHAESSSIGHESLYNPFIVEQLGK